MNQSSLCGHHSISKTFNFVYGHRLWNQVVAPCKCKYLHGHNGRLTLSLSGDLTRGMVLDFNELKSFKDLIDSLFDHRFFIDSHDPLLQHWIEIYSLTLRSTPLGYQQVVHHESACLKELFDSLIILPYEPTAEHLCMFFKDLTLPFSWSGLVQSIELFETDSSSAKVIL